MTLSLTRSRYPRRKEAGGLADTEECNGQLIKAVSMLKKSNYALGKIMIPRC
jgi:hypothetical protein